MAAFGNVQDMSGVIWECLGMSRGVWGCQGELEGVGGGPKGGVWQSFPLNFLQFQKVTNDILDIFQWTLRSQMSQISKCPKLRVVLGYWEALGEVSEMRYNNLLYSSSQRSYCTRFLMICMMWAVLAGGLPIKKSPLISFGKYNLSQQTRRRRFADNFRRMCRQTLQP